MEIIRIAQGDYDRYEELLLQRDSLRREADSCLTAYIAVFGDLINSLFQLQIDCIGLKKSIAFIQAALNRGSNVSDDELHDFLEHEMQSYNAKLEDMIKDTERAKKAGTLSEFDIQQAKKIYRRIAKLIHPDICPVAKEHPEILELWNRAQIAYRLTKVKELEEVEVLVNKALDDAGVETVEMVIPNLSVKIGELEQEITGIISTAPYIYSELLTDACAVQTKKDEFGRQIAEMDSYRDELRRHLEKLRG